MAQGKETAVGVGVGIDEDRDRVGKGSVDRISKEKSKVNISTRPRQC